jgi:cyclophilin family peptidyl-prolyl cis-trans isomerase
MGRVLISLRRVVPGFLVQTGDKTGTGAGGESIYGGAYRCFFPQETANVQ